LLRWLKVSMLMQPLQHSMASPAVAVN